MVFGLGNKFMTEEKVRGICMHRVDNSNSFYGTCFQSISRSGFVYHISNAAVLPRGGEGRERNWREKHCYQSWHFNIERL